MATHDDCHLDMMPIRIMYRTMQRSAHQYSIIALIVMSLLWSFAAIAVVVMCTHSESGTNTALAEVTLTEPSHIMTLASTQHQQTSSTMLVLNVSGAVELFAALKTIARDNDDCVTRAHVLNIESGHIHLLRTIKLEARHGGTAQFPTIIQGGEQAEFVQISGGLTIPKHCFQQNSNSRELDGGLFSQLSPAARQCGMFTNLARCLKKDVSALSLSSIVATGATESVIPIQPHIHSLDASGHIRDEWHLSRFPNKIAHMNQWTFIDDINVRRDQHFSFRYDNETATHVKQWNVNTSTTDIWMRGFWQYDSLDQSIAIQSINIHDKRIYAKTVPYFGVRAYARIYYENILAELDAPYEYYVDTNTGYLFIIPPVCGTFMKNKKNNNNNNNNNNENDENNYSLVLSQLRQTMIYIENTQHITLRSFTLQSSRGTAIVIHNSSYITIDHLHIRHIGNIAIICGNGYYYTQHLHNMTDFIHEQLQYNHPIGSINTDLIGRDWWNRYCGFNNIITKSFIHHCGAGAIIMGGGERKQLISGNNIIVDNTIHDYATHWRTSHAAITVDGVGQRISHNRIYNGAHTAVMLFGNDHEVHHNEISHVCRETSDAAAIYSSRDWTQYNYYIHHNLIHSLYSEYDLILNNKYHYTRINRSEYCHENNYNHADCYEAYGALLIGISLDDLSSGHRVDHNVMIGMPRGISIGGGRENNIVKNIFIDVDVPIHIDARGVNLFRSKAKVIATVKKKLRTAITKMNTSVWQERYPLLYLSWDVTAPIGNVVSGNVMIASGPSKFAPETEAVSVIMNDSHLYIFTQKQTDEFRENQYKQFIDEESGETSLSYVNADFTVQPSLLNASELISIDRRRNKTESDANSPLRSFVLWDDVEHWRWRRSVLQRIEISDVNFDSSDHIAETVASRFKHRAHCSVKEVTGWTTAVSVYCHDKQTN